MNFICEKCMEIIGEKIEASNMDECKFCGKFENGNEFDSATVLWVAEEYNKKLIKSFEKVLT